MKKLVKVSVFIFSLICLGISLKLFYNLGIFVDEFNFSPEIVYGGQYCSILNWIRLLFLLLLCIISGISVFLKEKK